MPIDIVLSEDVVQSLPQPLKDALLVELQRRLQGKVERVATEAEISSAPTSVADEEEQPADLSVAQATRYLEGCSEKTKRVIRGIVGGDRIFRYSALKQTLNMSDDDLSGVWGGLTKRARTILGDRKAQLITWVKSEYGEYDENDMWNGAMSEMAHMSFRKALGM